MELPFSEEEFEAKNKRRLDLLFRNINGELVLRKDLTHDEKKELFRLDGDVDSWVAARYPLDLEMLEHLERIAREEGLLE